MVISLSKFVGNCAEAPVVVPAVLPPILGVIKGPVDETALSDKDETETLDLLPVKKAPGESSAPGASNAPGASAPGESSSPGERRTRRSRSSVGDADPPTKGMDTFMDEGTVKTQTPKSVVFTGV